MLKKSFFVIVCFMSLSFFSKTNCDLSEEILKPNSIKLLSYKTLKQERGKILILPPTGGITYLEKKYSWELCEKGFSVFIISSWEGVNEEKEDLSIHNTLLSRAQSAITQVIEKKTKPGEFVGIFGTSVGGIHAAISLGQFPSIQAGFFIVAGVPVHKVIAYSTEATLSKYRKIRMKKFQFQNKLDYAKALNKEISPKLQPLSQAELARQKKSFAVIAKKDNTVPTIYQRELAKAFNSQTLELRGGHISSILFFRWFHKKKLIYFFETAVQDFNKKIR